MNCQTLNGQQFNRLDGDFFICEFWKDERPRLVTPALQDQSVGAVLIDFGVLAPGTVIHAGSRTVNTEIHVLLSAWRTPDPKVRGKTRRELYRAVAWHGAPTAGGFGLEALGSPAHKMTFSGFRTGLPSNEVAKRGRRLAHDTGMLVIPGLKQAPLFRTILFGVRACGAGAMGKCQ
jgi:hypothetical protein